MSVSDQDVINAKQSLVDSAASIGATTDLLHDFVHGDAATTIQTETGELRSLAKLEADLGLDYTLAEKLVNKAVDFTTVNDAKYPTIQAVKTYVDNATASVLNDRGNWDASVDTYPNINGSGTAGAIRKGDIFYISVAGTIASQAVAVGDSVRALINNPGQIAANWNILDANINYVAENNANKDATSGYAGLTQFKLNVMNAAGSIKSFLTSLGTAPRTYTLPDKDGTVAMLSDIAGAGVQLNAANSWTAKQSFVGDGLSPGLVVSTATEPAFIAAAGPSTADTIYISRGQLQVYSNGIGANWIYNFAWSSTVTLNNALAINQSITVTHICTQGAATYFCTGVTIDGVAPASVIWLGGAPTVGVANGREVYSFTIVKTAAATFTVFASLASYK